MSNALLGAVVHYVAIGNEVGAKLKLGEERAAVVVRAFSWDCVNLRVL
jgi:hypothetical protein